MIARDGKQPTPVHTHKIKCARCKGTGSFRANSRLKCYQCNGTGLITPLQVIGGAKPFGALS